MKTSIYRILIELTNGRFTSGLLKRFAQSKLSRFIIPSFARTYKINRDEIEKGINEYTSLHEFFIRKLKDGERIIDKELDAIVSPVDGMIEDIGSINENLSVNIKGKNYSLLDMLGEEEIAEKYVNGTYVLIYLSPSNYHRIHSPISGKITKQWTLGRKSYPVNRLGLTYGRDVLSKNYRKITELNFSSGFCAVVKVGAMFVNSIELTHKGEMIEKGEEMAYFTFGSTVILLFNEHSFKKNEKLHIPQPIKVGEKIGVISGTNE